MQRLTLVQRFMLAGLLVLVGSMFGVGWWVGRQIQQGVVHRTAATTALYVDSFVAPYLQDLVHTEALSPTQITGLRSLLQQTPLGQHIVAFKIWDARGHVVYSANPAMIGQHFPIAGERARAWRGEVVAEISRLQDAENYLERQRWPRLLEIYSPVRQEGSQRIIAVAEFYQTVTELDQAITAAQRQSWLLVAGATLLIYLLLVGIVRGGHQTIVRQQQEAQERMTQLTTLLLQNADLHERVQRAAIRSATRNERFLRRISSELHDGPAQALSLALLRLESAMEQREARLIAATTSTSQSQQHTPELAFIQRLLRQALDDMRTLAAGLRLPELEHLSPHETLLRVVRAHEQHTRTRVSLTAQDLPPEVALSVKITLYRLIQEALYNAFRHAAGAGQQVQVTCAADTLCVRIADQGPGFEWAKVESQAGHLGLVGMRERVESLGGRFHIDTGPGLGTTVIAHIPLATGEGEDYE
ncbi:MAG: sensor histidine kinase [Candidatus Tectimicrobiota bacterium]